MASSWARPICPSGRSAGDGGTKNPWACTRSPGTAPAAVGGRPGRAHAAVRHWRRHVGVGARTGRAVRGGRPERHDGRVSCNGIVAISWSLDHVGPITRTVEDNALTPNVLAGYDPRDATSASVPFCITRGRCSGASGACAWASRSARRSIVTTRTRSAGVRRRAARAGGLGARTASADAALLVGGRPGPHGHPHLRGRGLPSTVPARRPRPLRRGVAGHYGLRVPAPDVKAALLLTSGQYLRALQVRTLFTREFKELFEGLRRGRDAGQRRARGRPFQGRRASTSTARST